MTDCLLLIQAEGDYGIDGLCATSLCPCLFVDKANCPDYEPDIDVPDTEGVKP